jgi:hypothetical protein
MEEVIIINGRVDTGNSVNDLLDVKKALDETKNSSKNIGDVNKKFDELNEKLKNGGLSIRELNKLSKEFADLAAIAGRETPIGQQAINNAAKLKDEVGDLRNQVNRLSNDGVKMQAALQLGSTVVSGFTAVRGVTAMLGVENEKMLETITQLQAATSTLTALEQIRAAFEKESFLVLQGKILLTKTYTAVQWLANNALKAFPIIAIVSAVAGAITYFAKWESVNKAVKIGIDFIVESFEHLIDIGSKVINFLSYGISGYIIDQIKKYKELKKAEEERSDALAKQAANNSAQTMAEIKLLDEKNKKQQQAHDKEVDSIDFEIKKRQAAGQEYADLEGKKLKMIIERAKRELEIEEEKNNKLKELIKQQAELFGVSQEEILKAAKAKGLDVEAIEKNRLRVVEEQKAKIEKAERDLALFRIAEGKKAADKKKEQEKEITDAIIKENEQKLKEENLLNKMRLDATADSLEKRKQLYLLAYEKERQDIINEFGRSSELLKELEIKKNHELGLIELEYQSKKQEERKKQEDEQAKRANESAQKILKHEQDLAQARLDIERSILASLTSLGEIFIKDQAKLQKFQAHITAAQMALDSAKAISGAVAAGAAQPFPMNIAAIATGVATVLANIATAVKAYRSANIGTAPNLVSGSGSSGSNTQGLVMPRENPNGTLTAGFLGGNGGMQRVVVVQSDLEANHELSNKIKIQSTL